MNLSAMLSAGGPRPRREVIEVAERRQEDGSLDRLLQVRKQRLERLERECAQARHAWREERGALRAAKLHWREALREAKRFWEEARAGFFRMTTTSGQFRKAKAIYERMKAHAARLYADCKEAVQRCRRARGEFFAARLRMRQANLQQEKLSIMRDEIRLSTVQDEA